jgi:4'-phosphopantetheinyl transferase
MSAQVVKRQLSLLSEEELERHDRQRVPDRRAEYRVAHALLRTVLSCYRPLRPRDWRFREEQHGRPEIDIAHPGPRLRFNLSHTQGMVACVVAEEAAVGIDVESLARQRTIDRIAARSFAADELAWLETHPETDRPSAFLQIWTLKEAQLKAFGTGMQLPMRELSFSLDSGDGARLHYPGGIRDDAGRWQHRRLRPSPGHFMAVAVEADQPVDLHVEALQP